MLKYRPYVNNYYIMVNPELVAKAVKILEQKGEPGQGAVGQVEMSNRNAKINVLKYGLCVKCNYFDLKIVPDRDNHGKRVKVSCIADSDPTGLFAPDWLPLDAVPVCPTMQELKTA